MAVIEDFVDSSRINYKYIALSLKEIILANLSIAMNLSKCKRVLLFCVRERKSLMAAFIK